MSAQRLGVVVLVTASIATMHVSTAVGAGPYEPNDAPAAAAGPLLAGQGYTASLEASGDRDYFFFYVVSPDAQVALTVEHLGGGEETSQIDAEFLTVSGTPLGGDLFYIRQGERRTSTVALDHGKYVVEVAANEVNQGQQASYRLTAGEGGGTFVDYGPIASRCASATRAAKASRARLDRAKARLQRAVGRLRRARYGSRRARGSARARRAKASAQVAAGRRALNEATQAQRPWCLIPQ